MKPAYREVVRPVSACVVAVWSDQRVVALGTIIDADGLVITKASELPARITCRLKDGRELPARVVGGDDECDLALLKIDAQGLTPVKWGDPAAARVGRWLVTVAPGEEPISVGIVSVARRRIPGHDVLLGAMLATMKGGVRILQVSPASGAERAGIHVDDVIVSFDTQPMRTREELIDRITSHRPGQEVKLRIRRGTQNIDVTVLLGQRPRPRPAVSTCSIRWAAPSAAATAASRPSSSTTPSCAPTTVAGQS